jgi:hypothetical protein
MVGRNCDSKVMQAVEGINGVLATLNKFTSGSGVGIGMELVNLSNDLPHKVSAVLDNKASWSEQEKKAFLETVWEKLKEAGVELEDLELHPTYNTENLNKVEQAVQQYIKDCLYKVAEKQAMQNGNALNTQRQGIEQIVDINLSEKELYNTIRKMFEIKSVDELEENINKCINDNSTGEEEIQQNIQDLSIKVEKLEEKIKQLQPDEKLSQDARVEKEKLLKEYHATKSECRSKGTVLQQLTDAKQALEKFKKDNSDITGETIKSVLPELYRLLCKSLIAGNLNLNKAIIDNCTVGAQLANLFTVGIEKDKEHISEFSTNAFLGDKEVDKVDALQEKVMQVIIEDFLEKTKKKQDLVLRQVANDIAGLQEINQHEEKVRNSIYALENFFSEQALGLAKLNMMQDTERSDILSKFDTSYNLITIIDEEFKANNSLLEEEQNAWNKLQTELEEGLNIIIQQAEEGAKREKVEISEVKGLETALRTTTENLYQIDVNRLARAKLLGDEVLARELLAKEDKDLFDRLLKQSKENMEVINTANGNELKEKFIAWVNNLYNTSSVNQLPLGDQLEEIRGLSSKLSDTRISSAIKKALQDTQINHILSGFTDKSPLLTATTRFYDKGSFHTYLGDISAAFQQRLENAHTNAMNVLSLVSMAHTLSNMGTAEPESLIKLANDLPHAIANIIDFGRKSPPGAQSFF